MNEPLPRVRLIVWFASGPIRVVATVTVGKSPIMIGKHLVNLQSEDLVVDKECFKGTKTCF